MKFKKVSHKNIDTLYKLNKKLAIKEGQKELFTASKKEYKKAFLTKHSIAKAILIYDDKLPIGFYVYTYKFATYLAKKVLYIEDLYLDKSYDINKLFKHIDKKAKKEKLCRIELRVLKNYSVDLEFLNRHKYFKVTKWNVFRKEK